VGVSEAVSKSETVGVIMNVYSRKLRCCNTNISTFIAEHYFVVGISISKSKCFPQSWQEGGEGGGMTASKSLHIPLTTQDIEQERRGELWGTAVL